MKKLSLILLSTLLCFGFAACKDDCKHVYDNACDVTCNECGEERATSHTWLDADCDTPKTCSVCDATEGEALGHSPNTDDGDCTTAVTCSECTAVMTAAKESHTPNADDGDCTTAVTCGVCGTVTTAAKEAHIPNADDGDCTTAITCSECTAVTTAAKEAHTPNADDGDCTTAITCSECTAVTTAAKEAHTPNADDGDCTTAITCTECDYVFVESMEHSFNEEWSSVATHHGHTCTNEGCDEWTDVEEHYGEDDGDCTTAVTCSECDVVTTEAKAKHEDENLNGVCDYCDYKFDYVYDEDSKTYIAFTAQGLYAWAKDSWMGLNLTLGKDIVMPTEMNFDLNGDGINESNWDPTSSSYTIDGNGYSITGMVIKSGGDMCGFISSLNSSGIVKNLRVLDAVIEAVGINVAILVGYNNGLIENCGVSGVVRVEGNNVAGIAGTSGGTIIACYNNAEINATAGGAGGIVGQHINGSHVIACYNTGKINSEGGSNGGIAGAFYGGSIIASYSTASVSGSFNFGGIAGYGDSDGNSISNYWSTVGNTPEYGFGNKENNDTAQNVDGETVTWSIAIEAMNSAIADYNITAAEGKKCLYLWAIGGDGLPMLVNISQ